MMPNNPLAEVFGFPVGNQSAEAERYRQKKLCPFNNKVPNCTKDKANAPLGVCSITEGGGATITCPVRFREGWIVADDAASFFFPPESEWTSLVEVRLKGADGQSAGNIDIVLVAYDRQGKVIDFGSLEIQGVYISGNIRNPFEAFMSDPSVGEAFDWSGQNYPRADYLSSSRKRLIPQLLFKGGILHAWRKKSAVALTKNFFNTLPNLKQVPKDKAEVAWLVYDLEFDSNVKRYKLVKHKVVYTEFQDSLLTISTPHPGKLAEFVAVLQDKLDEHLDADGPNPPDAPTLTELL